MTLYIENDILCLTVTKSKYVHTYGKCYA